MVNRHVRENGMPIVSRGQYDMVACVQWYVEFLRAEIVRARRGDETEQQARARLIKATANLRELELEREEGRLLPIDHIKVQWERIVVVFKNKILSLPSKLPQKLIGLTELGEIKNLIEREVYEALSELSTLDIPLPEGSTLREPEEPYPLDHPSHRTTTEAHHKPVGGQGEDALKGVKRRTRTVENGAG
jgi:phage terminase Nu1 subunit (DNA packaging protein)